MPRIIASTDGTTTTVVAKIHGRPVLVKQSARQDTFLVVRLSTVSARVHGQALKVGNEIKVVAGTNDRAAAKAKAKSLKDAVVLVRSGNNYSPT